MVEVYQFYNGFYVKKLFVNGFCYLIEVSFRFCDGDLLPNHVYQLFWHMVKLLGFHEVWRC